MKPDAKLKCGMTVTCGRCGDEAGIEAWTVRPVSGVLPRDVFQCPTCGFAFERRQGPARVLASGFVMPGEVKLVPVGAVL
jgi:hypothetical protein